MRRWLIVGVSGLAALLAACAPTRPAPPVDAGSAPPVRATPDCSPPAPEEAVQTPSHLAHEPTLALDPALQAAPTEPEPAAAQVADDEDEAPEPDEPAAVTEPLEEIDFDPGGRSLRARRSITIRAEPRDDASSIGTLAQDVRVSWTKAVRGPGCDAWVEIEPRGWICDRYLEGNFRAPRARVLPLVEEGTLTPGTYARVVGRTARAYPNLWSARHHRHGHRLRGALTLRLEAELNVHHRRYWRTSDGEYVEARFLRRYHPSGFFGLGRATLEGLAEPLAWAQSRRHPREPVTVRAGPALVSEPVGTLAPRTILRLTRLSNDGRWAKLSEQRWVSLDDLHVARKVRPPPDAGPADRWIDVDLEEQVLVAYEGAEPVYATLISSGNAAHPTPEGLYRIWIKFAEVDMKGQDPGEPAYKVATVPWVMFFQDDFALHTSYWHDHFGQAVSHGCVNLSPRDARFLYRWSAPQVPDGWSMVYATADQQGSLLRIHRGPIPEPSAVASLICHASNGG